MQILILANHSGGLYDFRKDLIAELKKHANVTVAVPHNDRWEELHKLADKVIELSVDRRGMNPLHDSKLFKQYRAILNEVKPELVLTYTIKPNIYGGLACRMAHIPYAVNITGLGSAIENGGWLKWFVLTPTSLIRQKALCGFSLWAALCTKKAWTSCLSPQSE